MIIDVRDPVNQKDTTREYRYDDTHDVVFWDGGSVFINNIKYSGLLRVLCTTERLDNFIKALQAIKSDIDNT